MLLSWKIAFVFIVLFLSQELGGFNSEEEVVLD